jgi:hypothetical protein
MKIEGSGSKRQRHGSADPDGSTPKFHGSATLTRTPKTWLKGTLYLDDGLERLETPSHRYVSQPAGNNVHF